jgi:hypothetical protein
VAKAHLNFEDQGNGVVALQLIFDSPSTPFEKDSAAHQMALCAVQYLDKLLERRSEPAVTLKESTDESVIVEPEPETRVITPIYHLSGSG